MILSNINICGFLHEYYFVILNSLDQFHNLLYIFILILRYQILSDTCIIISICKSFSQQLEKSCPFNYSSLLTDPTPSKSSSQQIEVSWPFHYSSLLKDPTPCLDVSRMAWAVRTIRERVPIQRKAPHTQTEPAPVPRKTSK